MRSFICLAAAVLLLAPTRDAQADDAYRELKRINSYINSARKSFPTSIGDRIDYERRILNNLKKQFKRYRTQLKPELKVQKAAYKSVVDNLDDAEAYLAVLFLVHDAADKYAAITSAHRRGKAVSAKDLDALDKAVAKLKAGVNENWKQASENYVTRAAEVRAANPKVAKAANAKQASKESGERRRGARSALYKLNRAMSRNEEITDELLNALTDAIKPMQGKDEADALFFKAEYDRLRALASWDKDGETAPQAIAITLGGSLVDSGKSKGKKMKLKLAAQADRCYALFMRFDRWSGAEKIKDLSIVEKSKRPLQEFSIRQDNSWKTPRVYGFCTLASAKVAVNAKLEFAGTKNGVRYAFVEWERDKFPAALAGQLSLNSGDQCDFQHWFDLWDKPVPGTLVYANGEPVLIASPGYLTGNNGYVSPSAYRVGNADSRNTTVKVLSSSPPKSVVVKSKNNFKGCMRYGGIPRKASAMSKKIKKCHDGIDKQYASQWRSINRLRDAARRQNAISPSAERRADRLDAKQSRARAKKCGPLEKKAAKKAQQTYDKLADMLADKRHEDKLGRAEYLRQILK